MSKRKHCHGSTHEIDTMGKRFTKIESRDEKNRISNREFQFPCLTLLQTASGRKLTVKPSSLVEGQRFLQSVEGGFRDFNINSCMDSTTTHEPLSQAKQPLPSGFRPLRRIDSNVPRSTKQNVKPEKIEEEKLWPPPCPEQRKESGTAVFDSKSNSVGFGFDCISSD
ncbi:hypothetical protein AAMO2058_000564500 [Amorphochlora amoebiformis]